MLLFKDCPCAYLDVKVRYNTALAARRIRQIRERLSCPRGAGSGWSKVPSSYCNTLADQCQTKPCKWQTLITDTEQPGLYVNRWGREGRISPAWDEISALKSLLFKHRSLGYLHKKAAMKAWTGGSAKFTLPAYLLQNSKTDSSGYKVANRRFPFES